jgi:polar amino acid transport system substrate-binding protein
MADVSPAVRSEFAPTGKLRVGLNMSNFLLTATDAATGKPKGLAADMGMELGRRLGVPVELVPFPNPGAVADAAKTGVWDVGFIGAEPQRANEIDFTAAYVEIEATYLVPPGSPIKAIADVDRPGTRIAISDRSAYDLYLTRHLKHAELVRGRGDDVFKRFLSDKPARFAHPRRQLHGGAAGGRRAKRPRRRRQVPSRVHRGRQGQRPGREADREEQRARPHGRRKSLTGP